MPSLEKTSVDAVPRIGHTEANTTAVQVTDLDYAIRGILIKADGANTGEVFIGSSPHVTADLTPTGGFPLSPDASVMIEVSNPSCLYIIAAAAEDVAWIVL